MVRRFIFVLGFATAIAPFSVAQVSVHSGFQHAPRFTPGYAAPLWGHMGHRHEHGAYQRGYFYGSLPYFYDDYADAPTAATPSREVPIEIHSAFGPELTVKATPLLIELQGDRYVRYGGERYGDAPAPRHSGEAASENSARQPSERATYARPARSRLDSTTLTPTVLIYRDGHREEIQDYAIIGRIVYARTNDLEAGYVAKSIPVSAIDIAATIKANREQGVSFLLPGGPNEVVTRP